MAQCRATVNSHALAGWPARGPAADTREALSPAPRPRRYARPPGEVHRIPQEGTSVVGVQRGERPVSFTPRGAGHRGRRSGAGKNKKDSAA
jgi:hypothetical protein